MTTMRLYEIAQQHRALEALADSGEVPEEMLRDILDTFELDLNEKVRAVAHMIRHLESLSEAMTGEAKRMQERAGRVSKRAESIRAYLIFHMLAMGQTKFDYAEFTVAVKDNPESVVIDPTAIIPDEYMITPEPVPRPDKATLKAALRVGISVEGVRLERGQRVEIKV